MRRNRKRSVLAVLAAIGYALSATLACHAQGVETCTTTLQPGANIAGAITNAAPGSTICLQDGSYGALSLPTTTKLPAVTVRALNPGGPQVAGINVGNAEPNGVVLEGFTVTGNSSWGTSNRARNVTVRGMRFGTNQLDIRTNVYNQQNVLIDANTFGAFNKGSGGEGRLNIVYAGGPGSNPSGVKVTNNAFGPGGCSDGVQIGSRGVQVGPGNVFTGMVQGSCSTHVDAVQGYGDAGTVVTGNYFTGNTVSVGWYDGGSGHTFTDNLLQGVISFRGLSNTRIQHNTIRGNFRINGKNGDPSALTIRNNLFDNWGLVDDWGCTGCTINSNMFDSGATGTGNVTGNPTYAGGSSPSTYTGYALASGSVGKAAASDGLDMGIRVADTDPDPEPTPDPTPDPPTPDPPTAVFTVSPANPQTGQPVTFDASGSVCEDEPCTYTWDDNHPTSGNWPLGTGITLTFTFQGAGTKYVRLIVEDADGETGQVQREVQVTDAPDPDPTPDPTPEPTPEPTPDPDPVYDPACRPGCDQQIQDLRTENARLEAEIDRLEAELADARALIEVRTAERDAARTKLERITAIIEE